MGADDGTLERFEQALAQPYPSCQSEAPTVSCSCPALRTALRDAVTLLRERDTELRRLRSALAEAEADGAFATVALLAPL